MSGETRARALESAEPPLNLQTATNQRNQRKAVDGDLWKVNKQSHR
jgi:hypothetical protein